MPPFETRPIFFNPLAFSSTDSSKDHDTQIIFSELTHTVPPYGDQFFYDDDHHYNPCPGARPANEVNHLFDSHRSSWVLDTSQFPHKPPEMYTNGQLLGLRQALSEGEPLLRVLGVEMIGNGDTEKNFDYFGFFNEEKWGNIYFLLSPSEVCEDWSPPIPVAKVDSFRRTMAKLGGSEGETGWDRRRKGCPNKKEDLRSTAVLSVPLPGPFLSKYPFLTDLGSRIVGHPLGEKCEFGLLWQSVFYEKSYPILDPEGWLLPSPWQGTQVYCGRLMEGDDRIPYDTILLQFTFSIPEILLNGGTMVYAHNAEDQDSIMRGTVVPGPSVVKIALAYGGS